MSEVAFPTGTRAAPSGADLGYMRDLLAMVEAAEQSHRVTGHMAAAWVHAAAA